MKAFNPFYLFMAHIFMSLQSKWFSAAEEICYGHLYSWQPVQLLNFGLPCHVACYASKHPFKWTSVRTHDKRVICKGTEIPLWQDQWADGIFLASQISLDKGKIVRSPNCTPNSCSSWVECRNWISCGQLVSQVAGNWGSSQTQNSFIDTKFCWA